MGLNDRKLDQVDAFFLEQKLVDEAGKVLPATVQIVHQPLPSIEELLRHVGKANISVSGR